MNRALQSFPASLPLAKIRGYRNFIEHNPAFDEDQFKKKVFKAFLGVHQALAAAQLSRVRRFISDGMFDYLAAQLFMMGQLSQKIKFENIHVQNIYISDFENDGLYDKAYAAIRFSLQEELVCETNPIFGASWNKDMIEYWSFIRKRGKAVKDIYSTTNCPNCYSLLQEDMGKEARCSLCNTVVNTGEFDWILTGILKPDMYIRERAIRRHRSNPKHIDTVPMPVQENCVYLIEDKALSIMFRTLQTCAHESGNQTMEHASASFFTDISARMDSGAVLFNRLSFGTATLTGFHADEQELKAIVAVTYSGQRLSAHSACQLSIVEPIPLSRTEFLQMAYTKVQEKQHGDISMRICPSCGVRNTDASRTRCSSCSSPLFRKRMEWIPISIMNYSEYATYQSAGANTMMKPSVLDAVFSVHDCVLYNSLAVLGEVRAPLNSSQAESIARKWGYRADRIEQLFKLAEAGALPFFLPNDQKSRKRIVSLLGKALGNQAEENISVRKILDFAREISD